MSAIEEKYKEFEEHFVVDYSRIKWGNIRINPKDRASLLIVEDESSFRDMLKEIFDSQEIYRVDTAANGAEGLMKFQKERYDLILTDVMMDALNGIEMAEKIIRIKPDQKVFFVSSWSSKKNMFEKFEKQFTEGTFQFIDKPFDLDEFCNRVFLFMRKGFSEVVFNVLDRYALNRAVSNLDPYHLTVFHKELLNKCIFLSNALLNLNYTRESISSFFLKDKDYMKKSGCTYEEAYCRGNVCVKISPECLVNKLKKQIEIIVDLIEEIYDRYKRFELRKLL